MQEGKLIKLLKALIKEEFRGLEDYMNSPFFLKRNKDALLLFKAIKRQYPHFQSSVLLKKRVFKKVYPDQDYSDGKMRNLLTKVVKITESYLLYLDNEEDKFEKDKRLIAIYEKRGIEEEFHKLTNKLIKQLDALPYRDATFYYYKYILESKVYFHSKTKKDIASVEFLKKCLSNFEYYFILERSKLGIDLKNRKKIYSEHHNFKIDDLTHINLIDNYVYQLYQLSLQLIEKSEKSIFQRLESLYAKKNNYLRTDEQTLFFILLQNFIIQQSRLRPIEYKGALINLFKLGLKEKILFMNNKIKDIIFINIISVGLKNKEFSWVKSIIKNYGNNIIEEVDGLTITFCRALIAFYEKDYTVAIKLINSSPSSNNLNNFGLRTVIIRASFKVFPTNPSYYDIFINQCFSFEKYLIRNYSEVTQRVEMHKNFIKIIRSIGQLIYKKKWQGEKKKNLLLELNSEKKIVYKDWLIEALM